MVKVMVNFIPVLAICIPTNILVTWHTVAFDHVIDKHIHNTYGYLIKWFFSILLTHEGSNREVYRDFQQNLTSSAGGAKGCSDHRFRAPPAYTAQLVTLHQRGLHLQFDRRSQLEVRKKQE